MAAPKIAGSLSVCRAACAAAAASETAHQTARTARTDRAEAPKPPTALVMSSSIYAALGQGAYI